MSEKQTSDEDGIVTKANQGLKTFKLIPQESWLGGVCSGLAYKLGVPVWVVRLLFVVFSIAYAVGAVPYVLLWIFVPNAKELPANFDERTGGD